MNALIVNCSGLGDGLIEIPFLKCLETSARDLRYFHTAGILFRDLQLVSQLQLRTYAGAVPDSWRKFAVDDWSDISLFIRRHRIRIIVNLRHIGPRFDTSFFAFKRAHEENISFAHFDFAVRDAPAQRNIREAIAALLQSAGLVNGGVDPLFLRHLTDNVVPSGSSHIGLNVHTGNPFKRWPFTKWCAIGERLLSDGHYLTVFAGHTRAELAFSHRLVGTLNSMCRGRVMAFQTTDVRSVLRYLLRLRCVISVDSWLVHAATGVGVNTVGLYIVTDPTLWGGLAPFCEPVRSRHLAECENFDSGLGICRNGYRLCPLILASGDGIEVNDVLTGVARCLGSESTLSPLGVLR